MPGASRSLPDAAIERAPANIIAAHDEDEADHRFEQAHSSREAVILFPETGAVHVSSDDVRYVIDDRVIHDEYLLRTGFQHVAKPQDEHEQNNGNEPRQRNVPNLSELVRAVHLRRLVQLRIDGAQGCQIDDCAPARLLPTGRTDEQPAKDAVIEKEFNRLSTEPFNDPVDETSINGQQIYEQAADDDPRQKVGHVNNRLHRAFEPHFRQLVHQNGQQDRERK